MSLRKLISMVYEVKHIIKILLIQQVNIQVRVMEVRVVNVMEIRVETVVNA